MFGLSLGLLASGGLVVLGVLAFFVAMTLRRVVPTDEVHIVQSGSKTTSYGASTGNGNTYYQWPSSLPYLGVLVSTFKTSIFDMDLDNFEAYDSGRLPLVVDVKAFFRIKDSNVAAEKVSSQASLEEQLLGVVQGAVRSILANADIEEIMQGRSRFGDEFTKEVNKELASWGCEAVKNLELMDIRDGKGSQVIHNIMAKKQSLIEQESRTEVAKNKKTAEMAEIEARREVELQSQQAAEAVGLRTTQAERQVALAKQEALQQVKEQEKTTKQKEMEVLKVQEVRKAEITKEVQLVQAQQKRETEIINAEGQKQTQLLIAEGALEAKKREAEGIAAEGKAKADAERAMLSAPVEAQITLAKEIGANKEYQQYLVTIEQVKANAEVGKAQADALKAANIKVIANSGNVSSGINSMTDLFSSKGGTELGAMLEGFANTDAGQRVLSKIMPEIESKEVVSTEAKVPSKSSLSKTLNGKA